MYEYDLFAVINHEGQIDNGHYTNYARFQDEVRCQDPSPHPVLPTDHDKKYSGIVLTTKSEYRHFIIL